MLEKISWAARRGAAVDICRAALRRGSLTRQGKHWRYGRRRFSNATVKQLVDEGTAVRDGSIVRLATASVFPSVNHSPV
jgi:hypothetical protein